MQDSRRMIRIGAAILISGLAIGMLGTSGCGHSSDSDTAPSEATDGGDDGGSPGGGGTSGGGTSGGGSSGNGSNGSNGNNTPTSVTQTAYVDVGGSWNGPINTYRYPSGEYIASDSLTISFEQTAGTFVGYVWDSIGQGGNVVGSVTGNSIRFSIFWGSGIRDDFFGDVNEARTEMSGTWFSADMQYAGNWAFQKN